MARKRHRDGTGKGQFSWRKHEMIREVAQAQISVLNLDGKKGAIIDMHAGDGEGVDLPQADLFMTPVSQSTPYLAVELSHKCTPRSDVILCERNRQHRALLTERFGTQAQILANHVELLNQSLQKYQWVFVLNDPCGPSAHGIPILQAIVARHRRADLLIMVNEGSIARHLGVAQFGDDHGTNAAGVRGSRAAVDRYRWMYDQELKRVNAQAWAVKLSKRYALISRQKSSNRAYQGRLLLLTNYLANWNDRRYERIV